MMVIRIIIVVNKNAGEWWLTMILAYDSGYRAMVDNSTAR